jgi:translation initiation factor IF-3
LAEEAGLDLVEISPNADPPVVKIVDWGKYQYQKMKEAQKNRRSNKQGELKQMRFGMKIGQGDLDIKLRKVREFLVDGQWQDETSASSFEVNSREVNNGAT